MEQPKVGDRKVLVVEFNDSHTIKQPTEVRRCPCICCSWVGKGGRVIDSTDDGYKIAIIPDDNEVFTKGDLIAAECVRVEFSYSVWKRIDSNETT